MTYDELMKKIRHLEQAGKFEESIAMLKEMKKVFPENIGKTESEILKLMIRLERFENALDEALSYLYVSYDKKIKKWIFDTFYEPFREEAIKTYQYNL